MRPSGTLQSPTTGSLAEMIREADREDQIAAARAIPRNVTIQLPDAPVEVAKPISAVPSAIQANNTTANNTPATTTATNATAANATPNTTTTNTPPANSTTAQAAPAPIQVKSAEKPGTVE